MLGERFFMDTVYKSFAGICNLITDISNFITTVLP